MDDLLTTFWLPLVVGGKLEVTKLIEMMSEFNTAFGNYQAEQPEIGRNTPGVHGSSYADWPALKKNSREILRKHKLSIIQHMSDKTDDPHMAVYLKHDNGYMERYDCLAVKSAQYMKPQEFGGLNTYMKRYTYTTVLGIADPNEEDLDKEEYEKELEAEPIPDTIPPCPKCGSRLVKKNKGRGDFYACPGYPKCQHIHSDK